MTDLGPPPGRSPFPRAAAPPLLPVAELDDELEPLPPPVDPRLAERAGDGGGGRRGRGGPVSPRPRRRVGLGLAFLLVALVLVALAGAFVLYVRHELEPVSDDHSHAVTVTVSPGEDAGAVVDDLASQGLIRSARWFGLYARFKGLTSVAPGTYPLDSGMSSSTIVSRLEAVPGERAAPTVGVTFPEGLTAAQMGTILEKAGTGISAQQYLAEVTTGTFSAPFLGHRPAGASLEGFLFPDTYTVTVGASAHQVVQMQLDDFARKAVPLLAAPPAGQTDYQAVTIASIVEREARFPDDRGLVAGVIDNRLAVGMPLQVDATVAYGLHISGEPSDAQIHDPAQDTPYNTFLHSGLPPTPISNPGVAALTAAAHPTQSQYRFYVSDGCGHNHYAVDAASHQRNVQMYVGAPCAQ